MVIIHYFQIIAKSADIVSKLTNCTGMYKKSRACTTKRRKIEGT